jgi:hypothetical protein
MDSPDRWASTGGMTTNSTTTIPIEAPHELTSLAHPTWTDVTARIAKRSFAVVGTTSPTGHAHVAGILYDEVDGDLFVSIDRGSRKGRNLAANPHVAVTVPIRRIPFGPPSNAMFQSEAVILDNSDPLVRRLAGDGRLSTITGHGELELDEGCIVRIAAPSVIHTYGLGISLLSLMREPLRGGGRVERP